MTARTIDTGTNDLLARVEHGVAIVTMNRPERRNALSQEMLQAMGAVLAKCETDADVGVVVLTGAGGGFHPPLEGGSKNSKNFSGRGDVDEYPAPKFSFR
jgi:1,4-dihydroxy-2-naphthoyl-CoA synthase